MKLTVEERIKRFADYGYNPIHICGNWYLIRDKSRNYCKVSLYRLIHLREDN